MTNDPQIYDPLIIELDEYLDLSNFNLCVQEFKDTFDKIPNDYITIGQFTPDASVEDPVDAKTINLRVLKNYEDRNDWSLIDKEERFKDGFTYNLFPNIREFVSQLPFKSIGRIFISFTENGTEGWIGNDGEYVRMVLSSTRGPIGDLFDSNQLLDY